MSETSRQNISSNTKFEPIFGYSRAVRVGNTVTVSGTTALDNDDAVVGVGDVYAQTVYSIQKIERALIAAGASLADVIRTRIYVTDITTWESVARAHGQFFGEIRPAATLVEVSRLIEPDLLVEIEMDAIVRDVGQ